ncbi:MAG: hypothetical protein IT176_09745 [Acidobacteria bacterium]|nr:hypothetical protein [Acidobacteriota bacterium]
MGFTGTFSFVLTWWGLLLASGLDSTIFFFLPFGTDALVVYLAARHGGSFWLYPLLTTGGSAAGAALTFWMGVRLGEHQLARFVPERRLAWLKHRVSKAGATALGLVALLPPPFPMTAFVLTSGALDVDRTRFFGALIAARGIRFGLEAWLARRYGEGVLQVMESDQFLWVIGAFLVIAVVGTAVSLVAIWRRTRRRG